ncbi:MAG TPA: S66 peptidase family protein [Micromonosporaceae bacterium]|jgi:muramoyltetrapeptide carboxypeptidase LdcA involved in peptidoglycan recycling
MIYPPKPVPGDRVAILSPSAGLPGLFPEVYELGLARLRDEIGLVPVEYPMTRVMGASAADRAADIHAAFADPTITSVMASIGGSDQITVLRHLDVDLLKSNPKPFFGYSDNTNLLNFLFNAGIVSYHGGSVLVHLGRNGGSNPESMDSLRAALFTTDWHDLAPATSWTDEPGVSWSRPETLDTPPVMFEADGWSWHNADRIVEGRAWGGNIEIISWLLQVGRDIRPAEQYAGHVLFVESSEDMPSADEVYYTLRNMGERGLLEQFPAVMVARPKAWERGRSNAAADKQKYIDGQRASVLRALSEYAPDAMIVFNVDFGHTDPQLIIPNGGDVRIDGVARKISVRY